MSGRQLTVVADARDDLGRPVTGLRVSGQLAAADGRRVPMSLREVAPGRYRLTLEAAPPGASLIRLAATSPEGRPFAVAEAVAVAERGSEYRRVTGGDRLLASIARITGGRLNPDARLIGAAARAAGRRPYDLSLPLLWLGLGLLPLAVLLRRLPTPARRPRSG